MPRRWPRATRLSPRTAPRGVALRTLFLLIGLVIGLVFLNGCPESQPTPEASPAPILDGKPAIQIRTTVTGPIQPIPLEIELDQDRVQLGGQLFHEKGLSSDGSISCASCHNLELAGTDRKRVSSGVGGAAGSVNSPTVFNSGFNFKQFWDGRAETLEEQVDGPLLAEKEMNSDWETAIAFLSTNPEYVSSFNSIYPDGITRANVRDAIAEFERSLYTPNSRFDQYLRGDESSITEQELAGFELFQGLGCVSCHQGANVGGNMFETFGVMDDYFADRGDVVEADMGRFNVTGREIDRHVFKVPSLRNVALTPPYFHDGTVRRLPDAVRIMAKYNLGRTLSDEQVDLIVAFLGSLTGEYQGQMLP
ncbi:MAG: cytochrome-c peroxidase [Myxococcota bacterium]|nr:cytochrome-c peroxidase [Myxococcota bacterium]